MKLRIVKNILRVIEKKMEEVEILPIWSNQVAKNFKTLDKKRHFIADEVNFQEEF